MSDAPKQETKSWQARIGEATDAIAQTFVESMSYDWRLYKVDVAGSIAHATMLAKAVAGCAAYRFADATHAEMVGGAHPTQ